jgi:hypothetical protein
MSRSQGDEHGIARQVNAILKGAEAVQEGGDELHGDLVVACGSGCRYGPTRGKVKSMWGGRLANTEECISPELTNSGCYAAPVPQADLKPRGGLPNGCKACLGKPLQDLQKNDFTSAREEVAAASWGQGHWQGPRWAFVVFCPG